MVRYATDADISFLSAHDKHIAADELARIIGMNRVLVAHDGGRLVGWLRYGLFWDNTPFMNMLYVIDGERGKGQGRALASYWEDSMRAQGYERVMTSTQSDEQAQHFYRKLGYSDAGALLLPGEPLEIIMIKDV